MATPTPVHVDPNVDLDFNVVSQSPHVDAFRVWTRPPGGDWSKVDDGTTDGDHHKNIGRVATGGGIAYWIGVGGNPGTNFRLVVSFSQGGKVLPDGTFVEEGTTNDDGFAVAEREMVAT